MTAAPVLVILLGTLTVVHGPDLETITAAPRAGFELALDEFQADTGLYPTKLEGLQALIVNPGVPRWGGPYISEALRRYIDWFEYSIGASGKPVLIPGPPSSPPRQR